MKLIIFIIVLTCLFSRGFFIKRLRIMNSYVRSPILDIGLTVAIFSLIVPVVLAESRIISYDGNIAFMAVVVGALIGLVIALAGAAIEVRKNIEA